MNKFLVVASVWIIAACAHPYYRDQIPNGYRVPNPCGGGIWEAVGHFDPLHHTQLKNNFAMDFAANGHHWTSALCNKDSDGDGRTNGEELGDPTCVWTPGHVPTDTAIGHPGICEPLGCDGFHCGCHGHACLGK